MNILESEIEEILFKNLKNEQLLKDRGFRHFEKHYYLHPNFGSYGIPDIVGVSVQLDEGGSRFISVTIYELKKEFINIDTLLQASRYAKAINIMFQKHDNRLFYDINIKIVLIGKKIETNSDFIFLCDYINNVCCLTYSIDILNGLSFNFHSGYCLKNEKPFILTNFISDLKKGLLHKKNKIEKEPF